MATVTKETIIEAVREHVSKETPERAEDFQSVDPDASLFELGFLDSLTFVSLVESLEERFGIKVPPADFAPRRWRSLNLIAEYVEGAVKASG